MSSKKLQATILAGVSILVVVFAFALINITGSSALAKSTRNQSQPINRTVYRVTAGNGDAALVNVRNENCAIVQRKLKIGAIVAIDKNATTIKCSNEDGNEIVLYKLSERAEYVAINNLGERAAQDAFNKNNQAQVASPRGLRIRDDQCKLLNESDNKIPKALKNGTIVTLPDPNKVNTKTCDINDGGLFTFEMVEIKFEYQVNKQTQEGVGYVAQEFLKPAP